MDYLKDMKTKKTIPVESINIGKNLRYLREAAGISQRDIGYLLNVSYQQIQKYEAGENRFPIEKLFHLKNFYDVPYEIFFRGIIAKHIKDIDITNNCRASIYAKLINMKNSVLRRKIERIILILLE